MLRRLISAVISCVLIFILTSCGDNSTGGAVYYETAYAPITLDPQLADSESERMFVTNCFEGLYRAAPSGLKPMPALAAKTEISADGLTYTFTLESGAKWSEDDIPVTAGDFAFALTRALLPETRSPDAELLYAIEGAEQVRSGVSSASALGISVPDEQTLIIRLAKPDEGFLSTLTLPVAMPCNKDFFESCKGRYGLDAENLLTNGPFYVRRWLEERITLWRFKGFSGKYPTALSAAVVYFNPDLGTLPQRIAESDRDAGEIPADTLIQAEENGLATARFETVCWALILNPGAQDTGGLKFREALSESLDPACYSERLGGVRRRAASLIPPDLLIYSSPYSDIGQADIYNHVFDLASAKEKFLAALAEMEGGVLPPVTLLYPETEDARLTASLIAQNWQKNLGAYINIQGSNPGTYEDTLGKGDYRIALLPLSSPDGSVRRLLSQLTEEDGALLGFKNSEFDTAMSEVSSAVSAAELAGIFSKAGKTLIDSKTVIPLFYDLTCYACAPDVTGIQFSQNAGAVSFVFADKPIS
ncbi:MAG TPA: hypothetical protein DEQ02_03010 [Ruminococcaceae bacterium]|nr:hypothetical protein [Oscillospiraceae bacterium]